MVVAVNLQYVNHVTLLSVHTASTRYLNSVYRKNQGWAGKKEANLMGLQALRAGVKPNCGKDRENQLLFAFNNEAGVETCGDSDDHHM